MAFQLFVGIRHDIAVSSIDPAVKSVMEACIAENEADKHASNLKVTNCFLVHQIYPSSPSDSIMKDLGGILTKK